MLHRYPKPDGKLADVAGAREPMHRELDPGDVVLFRDPSGALWLRVWIGTYKRGTPEWFRVERETPVAATKEG